MGVGEGEEAVLTFICFSNFCIMVACSKDVCGAECDKSASLPAASRDAKGGGLAQPEGVSGEKKRPAKSQPGIQKFFKKNKE